jgi:hypothetical protein
MAILVFSNETDGIHLSSGRLGVILQGRLVSIPRTEVTVTEASADKQRLVSLLRIKRSWSRINRGWSASAGSAGQRSLSLRILEINRGWSVYAGQRSRSRRLLQINRGWSASPGQRSRSRWLLHISTGCSVVKIAFMEAFYKETEVREQRSR